MLRAAVKAGTPTGAKAKSVMDAGGLVSDEIVVGIIADRVREADAKRGFILDGFPRTVAQAEALDALLARTDMGLDAIVELKVDEKALLGRIEKRARDMVAAGGTVRADDNPEAFKVRLDAYREQTAPVSAYYARKGTLKTVDGMMPIDDVTKSIDRLLGA